MLFASVYALARLLVAILLLRAQAEAERDLELLALRHEVAILCRQVKRLDMLPTDRVLLAALGRRLPVRRLLFTPATILHWHRELVRRRWSTFGRRPRRGRPPIPEELRSLIVRLARETRGGASAGFRVNSSSSAIGSPTRRSARSFALIDSARRRGAWARLGRSFSAPTPARF